MLCLDAFRRAVHGAALLISLALCAPAGAKNLARASASASTPVLKVCMSDEPHPPWRLAGPNGGAVRQGLDFAFLDELHQRTQVTLEIVFLPGTRCLRSLETGEQDAMFAISHLPEREAQVRYPGPPGQPDTSRAVRQIEYAWYVPKNSALRWDGVQLKGLRPTNRVGVQRGYAISARLRAQHLPLEEGPASVLRNLEMLQRGRFSALAVHGQAAEAVLAHRPDLRQTLHRLRPELESRAYYLVFSHQFVAAHEARANELWQAALSVRDSEHLHLQDPKTWRVFDSAMD